MDIRCTTLIALLIVILVGCGHPHGLVEEFFEEAKEGDLKSFREHLTEAAQMRYGDEMYLRKISQFLGENESWEFSLDNDYQWDRQTKIVYATGYMAFLQRSNSVYWAKSKLHCLETMSFSDGQPHGVKCKIDEIEWPERIDEPNHEIAWKRALFHLAAYSCNWTDIKTLLNEMPSSEISYPLFPSGETPLSITKQRALTEISRYSECRNIYQTLRYRSNSKK